VQEFVSALVVDAKIVFASILLLLHQLVVVALTPLLLHCVLTVLSSTVCCVIAKL
jgi:hypothetical protein